jgi:nucleoside-diphosphate-sugar epimerase
LDGVRLLRYIVLGHTGFIGSVLYSRLIEKNFEVIGVNSSVVSIYSASSIKSLSRFGLGLYESINEYINEDTVVFNCVWGKLTLQDRDSIIHYENAKYEIDLLKEIKNIKLKSYISFGSILELYEPNSDLEKVSKYVQSKRQVHQYLESTELPYAWIRVASVFGLNDSKTRVITQILKNNAAGTKTVLNHPDKVLNIYHVEKLIDAVLALVSKPILGNFTAVSETWLTVSEIKKSVEGNREPKYISKIPLLDLLDSRTIMQIESTSFQNFVKEFNRVHINDSEAIRRK